MGWSQAMLLDHEMALSLKAYDEPLVPEISHGVQFYMRPRFLVCKIGGDANHLLGELP